MNKIAFTTSTIDGLELPAGKADTWFWDRESAGLGIRLRAGASGTSRTWYASYRFGNEDKRLRLGDVSEYTLADARNRVYELRRNAADGVEPTAVKASRQAQAVRAVNCPSFAAYAEHYLGRKLKELRPNTYRERERYLTGPHFEPFRRLRLNQISKQAIAARLNWLEDTGVTKASAHVAQAARMALLDMFKMAAAEGLIDVNPVLGTRSPLPPKQQKARDRVLDAGELAAVWNAAGDDDYGRILKLAILLGSRREEIGAMQWGELADGVWTLPAARSKNGRANALPLPAQALEILRAIPHEEGREHVFGSRSTDGFTDWSGAKRKLDARLELPAWHLHDLRRSAITGMHELGIEPHVVEAVVNHAREASVHNKHYNLATYREQKAEALRRWADKVAPANVIRIAA
jgi:integrase